MALPVSIGDIVFVIGQGIQLYEKIHDRPKEIRVIGEQLKGLRSYLSDMKTLTDSRGGNYLANLQSQQRFRDVLVDIHRDAEEVNEILKVWNDTEPYLRWMFLIGRNPGRLEALMKDINTKKVELSLILEIRQHLEAITPSPIHQQQHVEPPRTDYGLLFVDPNNVGRSKVAEGYTKLLREWTNRTGGIWSVKFAHSAGIGLRHQCDCVDDLLSLNMKIPMNEGNKAPHPTAMASLFDNKFFNESYKDGIKDDLLKSRSRGITQTIFQTYDFILVFVDREYNNLQRLKDLVIQTHGSDIAPCGKGRIIHLGSYLSKTSRPVQIIDAPKNNNGSDSIENWNATTKQVKIAFKVFLSKELGWVEPSKTNTKPV